MAVKDKWSAREKGITDYQRALSGSSIGYQPNRDRRHPKKPNFFDRVGQAFTGGAERAKEYLPGTVGMATRGLDAVLRNRKMHGENVGYFGGNWLDSKVPNKVKESLMTPRDEDFYDKYMNLASMTDDTEKKQYYIDQANTARQNMQITGRLNYGLGQVDPEGTYTNREGLPSYSQDLFGEGFNRFNLERFKEAMGMGEGILGGLDPDDRHPEALHEYEKETLGIDEKTREQKIQELIDEKQRKIDNWETDINSELLDDMTKDQWPTSGYRFEFDDYVQDRMDALRNAPKNAPLDEREDYIRKQHEYTPPVIPELGTPNPQLDFPVPERYTPLSDISIELGADEGVAPPPIIPFDDSGREAGISALYGQGPMWGETNRRLEGEYRDYIERTGDKLTYEEFEGAWERLHALPRGLHYQEPRAGIR